MYYISILTAENTMTKNHSYFYIYLLHGDMFNMSGFLWCYISSCNAK